MTELETLERAKMYMEKLANGINPIDGSIIPEEEVINNVRLSRCFFYVADVLRQVIDNGGVAKEKKINKIPFGLIFLSLRNYPKVKSKNDSFLEKKKIKLFGNFFF